MYEIGFEHENNMNFMVIFSDKLTMHESYQLKMLMKNRIKGMLPISIRYIDNKKAYYYEITSKQQMTRLYEFSKITWKDVRNICISISELVKVVNEYMLDLDSVILKPECMFIDVASQKINFTYCMEETQNFSLMMKDLFEYILEHYDHNTDKEELMQVYAIYQKIMHNEYDPENLAGVIVADENLEREEKQCSKADDSYIRKETLDGHVIETIPQEEISNDIEVSDTGVKQKIRMGMAICGIMVGLGMISLFMPSKAILKLNLAWSVVIIIAGTLLYLQLKKRLKGVRYSGKIVNETYQQHYTSSRFTNRNSDGCLNDTEDDRANSASENNADDTCEQDLPTTSEVEMSTASGYNTICLSDYTDMLQTKKNVIVLYYQENKCEGNPECNHERDLQTDGEKRDGNLRIEEFPCVIGNFQGYCNVLLQNPMVSRVHLRVKKEKEKYFVEDMNSTNGTFVNDRRIGPNEKAQLANGDIIKIAALTYKVEIS